MNPLIQQAISAALAKRRMQMRQQQGLLLAGNEWEEMNRGIPGNQPPPQPGGLQYPTVPGRLFPFPGQGPVFRIPPAKA